MGIQKKVGHFVFSSQFDSGNLADVTAISDSLFQLWTSPDCEGTIFQNSYRTWFYFSMQGGTYGKVIRFRVKNLNNQAKLYRHDFRPVFLCPAVNHSWKPISEKVEYLEFDNDTLELRFCHRIRSSNALTFFAFCIPYSYRDLQEDLDELMELRTQTNLYLHRELLCHSLERRRVDLLTISSLKGLTDIPHRTLRKDGLSDDNGSIRSKVFKDKKIVFISARVHPGETPASHMMKGLINFLLEDDPRSVALRDHFVFKLVPMLNPDGVSRGHYRTDSRGVNLNRCYVEPTMKDHPTIRAVVDEILLLNEEAHIKHYIDLHAHASKRGFFMFGNALGPDTSQHVDNLLLPKLLSLNSPHFDLSMCCFSSKKMNNRDRKGDSKAGCGRVNIYRRTGLTHCYTLEANYNCGKTVNQIPTLPTEPMINIQCEQQVQQYSQKVFEDVGKALAISILDLSNANPWSRLPHSVFESLENLFNAVQKDIKQRSKKTKQRLGKVLKKSTTNLQLNVTEKKNVCEQNHNELNNSRLATTAKDRTRRFVSR